MRTMLDLSVCFLLYVIAYYLYGVGTTNFVPTLMRCLQAPKSGVLTSGGTSSRAQLSL
jgi:hypothetical protein